MADSISRYYTLLFAFALLACGVSYSPAEATEKIRWVGCGITKFAFTRELAEAFQERAGIEVDVRGGGAMKGIRDAATGHADIGGTCRYALDDPRERDVTLHHVAWDALVLVTAEGNPVDDITLDQVLDVFEGRISNWEELGGDDLPITLQMRRGKLSGVGHMFRVMFFNDPDKMFPTAQQLPRSSGLL